MGSFLLAHRVGASI